MPESILSDYFYGDESEQFVFFKIPASSLLPPSSIMSPQTPNSSIGMLLDRTSASGIGRGSLRKPTSNALPARQRRLNSPRSLPAAGAAL